MTIAITEMTPNFTETSVNLSKLFVNDHENVDKEYIQIRKISLKPDISPLSGLHRIHGFIKYIFQYFIRYLSRNT